MIGGASNFVGRRRRLGGVLLLGLILASCGGKSHANRSRGDTAGGDSVDTPDAGSAENPSGVGEEPMAGDQVVAESGDSADESMALAELGCSSGGQNPCEGLPLLAFVRNVQVGRGEVVGGEVDFSIDDPSSFGTFGVVLVDEDANGGCSPGEVTLAWATELAWFDEQTHIVVHPELQTRPCRDDLSEIVTGNAGAR